MQHESGLERQVAQLLRALPTDDARPDDWSQFDRRRARTAPRRQARGVGGLAPAAVFAVAIVAVSIRLGHHAELSTVAVDPAVLTSASGATTPVAEEPRAAERWLAGLPREPAIVRVGTRADVLGLEDRIAQVDDLLTASSTDGRREMPVVALQRERARLVNSLVQVRYAETLADESR